MADSFAAKFGQILVPVLKPVGLGSWQIAVALISGISAKEVVVSSMSVLYGIGNINSAAGMAELSGILGGTGFTAVNAYALMVFCLLYTPCVAAIASVKRELGGRWACGVVIGQCLIAWLAAFVVHLIGTFF